MAIKTSAELKAYFETNDTPSQAQFGDFIDTMFGLMQQAADAASDAADSAAAAVASVGTLPTFKFLAIFTNTAGAFTIHTNINVASIGTIATGKIRLTFTAAIANGARLSPFVSADLKVPSASTFVVTRNLSGSNATSVDVQQVNSSSAGVALVNGVYAVFGL